MRGDLSQVADSFRCRQCDGTIKEVDLAEDLLVTSGSSAASSWQLGHHKVSSI